MAKLLTTALLLAMTGCAQSSFTGNAAAKLRKSGETPAPGEDDGGDSRTRALLQDMQGDGLDFVDATLRVTFGQVAARNKNCLKLAVDGRQPVDIGCNRGTSNPQVVVKARAKPHCNVVRLIFTTTDWQTGATAVRLDTATQTARLREICRIKAVGGTINFNCEDGDDAQFDDLDVSVVMGGEATFQIQGSGQPCG